MEISVIIAAIAANILTSFSKPVAFSPETEEEIKARRTYIRGLNALFGLVTLTMSAYFLGEPLEVSSVEGLVGTIISAIGTFIVSQGGFFLFKK